MSEQPSIQRCVTCGAEVRCTANAAATGGEDYCGRCGTAVPRGKIELVSLSSGERLPGGFVVDEYMGVAEGALLYRGRTREGQPVLIREAPQASACATGFTARYTVGSTQLLPTLLGTFCAGNRVYAIEEPLRFDHPYFEGSSSAHELVRRLRQLLVELAKVHQRGWSLAAVMRRGIFTRGDSSSALLGKGGYPERIGEPLAELSEYLRDSRLAPGVVHESLDLLAVMENLWPILGCEESWGEAWSKAAAESAKPKRRDIFFRIMAFSPRVIEWPPLGEVLSDFLSEPSIWSTHDLLDRLTANPPARSIAVEVISHRGLKRSNNEDAALANQYEFWFEGIPAKVWLLVVADGMGGAGSGEIAARIAVETVDRAIHDFIAGGGLVLTEGHLRSACELANSKVHDARKNPRYARNMGTTLLAALCLGTRYLIAWVGDSRAYLVDKEGKLKQLTQDHTMVAELIRDGSISAEQAASHPFAGKLTRAIGTEEQVKVEVLSGDLSGGESLMLVSDGFVPALSGFAFPVGHPLRDGLDALTARMLKGGGADNASAVVLRVE